MLLHDNYNPLIVSLQAVVSFHYKVKCTNCILCVKCISTMADSDKTLIGDGNLSNNNRNSSVPNFVPPTSGTVQPETHPTHVAISEPSTLKRKQTSFQITSVTVKGSRLSTDGGEDSADDLDESHTEDASSDILDCSRTTDVDNDQLSEDNSNTNNDDSSILAPSIPVKCIAELPVKHDAHINAALKFPSESSKAEKPSALSEITESDHIVTPSALPDQWQHRFRVVKIVSSEPFKRGRWLCMDFMDPPAPIVEVKPEVSDSTSGSGTHLITGTFSGTVPSDRVAHIYEISPSDAYPGSISVAVGPDQNQQPMYGIFLPVNHSQYPLITGMYSGAMSIRKESKHQETPQSAPSNNNGMQQSQNFTAGQTVYTDQQSIACTQAQVMPTATPQQTQNPAHPAAAVQTCMQHQSQTVQAPTTTSATQPAATAPIPATTSQSVSSQPQMAQDSQLALQQRMQTSTPVQSQPIPAVTTQNTSSAATAEPALISSTQVSNVSQTSAAPASAQSQIHQVSSMPSAQQVTSVSSGQTQVQQNTNVSSAQPQVQQITSLPSVHPQVQQVTGGHAAHTQVHQVNSGHPTQSQVQQISSGISAQPQISGGISTQPQISSGHATQPQVQQISSGISTQPQVQQLSSGQSIQPQVQQMSSGQSIQPQVQQMSSGQSIQPQAQQISSGQSIQPQVQQISSGQSTQPQAQQILSGQSTQSQAQQILSGQSTQSQAQQILSGQSTQSQAQQLSSGQTTQPQVQPIANNIQPQLQHGQPSAQPQVQQVTSLPSLHSQGQVNSSSGQTQAQQVTSIPSTQTSTIGTQASTAGSIAEVSTTSSISKQEAVTVPSQAVQNHIEGQELGTPSNIQTSQEVSSEAAPAKSDVNGEDSESVPSGTSTVAIDNKIEQAMDLVKSHLMFAVREEVDVLKEKITELMDRISQLEYENGFLRANASHQTLEQLNQSQLLQQQQQTQPSTVSMNSFPQVTQQPMPPQQLNIQNQQSTS